MKLHFPFLLCCIMGSSAFADTSTPRQSFDKINRCAQAGNLALCRDLVTASSLDIFDRFSSYNLARCLPPDASYISEQTNGSQSIIRASIGTGTSKRFARIILAQEENEWKLDLPESLRTGMGENWEKQLTVTEQLYLMMKNQMGTELSCDALQKLIQPKK